jgi:hypothetical protein
MTWCVEVNIVRSTYANPWIFSLSLLALNAVGCAAASDAQAPMPLDTPFVAQSQPVTQGGTLSFNTMAGGNATVHHVELNVGSAPVRVSAEGPAVNLESLSFTLGDLHIGADVLPPNGFDLKNLVASLMTRSRLEVTRRDNDSLIGDGTVDMALSWQLALKDGTSWKLDNARFKDVSVELSIATNQDGHWISVDASCTGMCWEVPGVVSVGDLALHVDAPAQVVTPDQAPNLPVPGVIEVN